MSLNIKFNPGKIRMAKFIRYMMSSDHHRIINRHLAKATSRNGLEVAKRVREVIKEGNFQKNAKLTLELKKSTKPLVNSGQLFRAVTSKRISDLEVFVGILRTNKRYNIAETIHGEEGKDYAKLIPVTDKMRGMFYLLYRASIAPEAIADLRGRARELWDLKPGGWYPLNETTTHIKIPSRPFMEMSLKDPELVKIVHQNWVSALDDAFSEIKRKVM